MRVIVLGGYGNFGARICRELQRRGLEVIATGRNPDRGHAAAGFDTSIGKACLDIDDPLFTKQLRALAPGVVIHCVGPFQGQDYRVAEAAIECDAHYIDLADGRAFVAGFEKRFGGKALEAGLLAVSGASTLPALSSAVIDTLTQQLVTIDEIQISIAPAQRSPRGEATLRAVFSYLGSPFDWYVDGSWRRAIGWQELRRIHFKGLGWRWAAACDVPDLELLLQRYSKVRTVQFRASLEFAMEHFVLAGLATLSRIGIPIPLTRWATPFERMAVFLGWWGGEHGGMLVSVTGNDSSGNPRHLEWHLTSGWREGPEIPCLAAILIAERLARGDSVPRGGNACMGYLELNDFEPEFRRLGIRTEIMESTP